MFETVDNCWQSGDWAANGNVWVWMELHDNLKSVHNSAFTHRRASCSRRNCLNPLKLRLTDHFSYICIECSGKENKSSENSALSQRYWNVSISNLKHSHICDLVFTSQIRNSKLISQFYTPVLKDHQIVIAYFYSSNKKAGLVYLTTSSPPRKRNWLHSIPCCSKTPTLSRFSFHKYAQEERKHWLNSLYNARSKASMIAISDISLKPKDNQEWLA